MIDFPNFFMVNYTESDRLLMHPRILSLSVIANPPAITYSDRLIIISLSLLIILLLLRVRGR